MDAAKTIRSPERIRAAGRRANIARYVTVTFFGFLMLYLFIFAFLGSLTTQTAFEQAVIFPKVEDLFGNIGNYVLIFKANDLARGFFWTVGRILLYFVINTVTSVLGGYLFAKVEYRGRQFVFLFLLSSMMIPGVAMLVPNYVWMTKFPLLGGNNIFGEGGNGLINNPLYMFITGWVNVYFIFLCRQAFLTLDDSMGESAEIDGAGFLTVIFRIYMPLIKPILAVIMINTATGMWNDYMTCFLYIPDIPKWHTIGTSISTIFDSFVNPLRHGGPDYPKAMAVSIVTMVPPVLVFVLLQKQFVEGLAMGGVKG